MNECEDLFDHLEHHFSSPAAPPDDIAIFIASLPSSSVQAGRQLHATLLARLDEIAEHHGGRVPLHGRLFAQWMHHAYPRECPYPNVAGSTNPMTPDEWMARHGDAAATMEDMKQHVSMGDNFTFSSLDDGMGKLPWSSLEELVAAP